jgi:hypothetical protein
VHHTINYCILASRVSRVFCVHNDRVTVSRYFIYAENPEKSVQQTHGFRFFSRFIKGSRKCGAAPTPAPTGASAKRSEFDPRREQSCYCIKSARRGRTKVAKVGPSPGEAGSNLLKSDRAPLAYVYYPRVARADTFLEDAIRTAPRDRRATKVRGRGTATLRHS